MPDYKPTIETLSLLAEAESILFLLMEPVYDDEKPSNAMIGDLYQRINAHLLNVIGNDLENKLMMIRRDLLT